MGRPKSREPINQDYEIFGQRLAKLRKARNLSQAELSKEVGIATSSIAEYEMGTQRIQLSTIKILSEYFGVSVDELIGIKTDNHVNTNTSDPLVIEIEKANFTLEEKSQLMDYARFIMSKRE